MSKFSVLILAAGKGVRMKSGLPKVLHPIGGVPLIGHVLTTVLRLKPAELAVVIGHHADAVKLYVKGRWPRAKFFVQDVLDGSGGAVRRAIPWLKKQRGDVIVTCGDMPLQRDQSLKDLAQAHRREGNAATVLSAKVSQPTGYGRIVREIGGGVRKIVEELDATEPEKRINEINTGTYCFEAKALAEAIRQIKNNNAKKEFYLTDVISILKEMGCRVGAVVCQDPNEASGVNQRADLAHAEAVIRKRKLEALMKEGVTVIDPESTYVTEDVEVGPDTIIYPQTFILGKTRIGSHCQIGPWAHITDCTVENDVIFRASFAEASIIRKGARVGPFSRIRPKSELGPHVHFGNFSEVKNSKLGEGSKVNHLSYLGDATVGKNVNIGAGTITCNYDGIRKHPTTIQDHVFIGS
ncbi:MAG: bifunctional UDP-N-acetylglucosamine diphosphorylase/glucosamine-1-phosphate N-acetyltransferase GlmU, partial [Elusimicrobia bacterium]|nr:bifunctional UDP-N-acetylglucosamine diphosphorylase/glucosamine-1-phosphate N-acetyltransferase GlmU [Candidatus Obscuribacterium magneticum]MCB4757341.1 bifunctional UDP-N-acetylglucosamine diphosphorylase/glucosamine-1-phosphate N-acetyltransferase GlmU [Candidatus Obscuribacterium magneticum]